MNESTTRKRYPSDLTDAQWELLAPFIPLSSPNATQEVIPRREIVNGVLFVLRMGCSWRQMSHDLPNPKIVYHFATVRHGCPSQRCRRCPRFRR